MNRKLEKIYELGIKAQRGNQISLVRLIECKRSMIKKYSNNNDDCYQHIIERLLKAIQKYNFKKF